MVIYVVLQEGRGVCMHGHIYGPHTHFDLNQVGKVGSSL